MSRTTGDINVVMADDHEIFRDGFRLTLSKTSDIHLVAEASNGVELIELVEKHRPHVVITDIKMPRMDGIEATRAIRASKKLKKHNVKVLVLSMYDNYEYVSESVRSGASGYVLKNAPSREIIAAIEAIASGGTFYSAEIAQRV